MAINQISYNTDTGEWGYWTGDPNYETPTWTPINSAVNPANIKQQIMDEYIKLLPADEKEYVANSLSYDSGSSASDMAAQITRATYEDWKKTYLPVSRQLMNESTYLNPNLEKESVAQAVSNVNRTYDASTTQRDRTAYGYGTALTGEQQAVGSRVNDIERSSAVVDAASKIRQKLADRNKEIALGSVANLGGKSYGGE